MHLKGSILLHLLALRFVTAANLFSEGRGSRLGVQGRVTVSEVKCVLHRIEPLMINATEKEM